MTKYLIKKTLGWLLMIFLATNLAYLLAASFLDPRSNYTGRRPPLSPEEINSLLEPYNLSPDTPLVQRWWTWLTNILTKWDWGQSPVGEVVNSEISYRIWQGISIIAMNTPVVVASIAVVWGALKINELTGKKIFYVVGSHSLDVEGFFPNLMDSAQHLVLPTISLVFISYASYHMTQRTLLLDNLDADYVRTARAKGLTRQQAIRKHALRTSIIPVATSVAFSIPGIFTGAVMTERIFGWNGMGQYFIETISKNDVNGAAAVAAFGAAMTAISAVLADLVVVALDPRVRVS